MGFQFAPHGQYRTWVEGRLIFSDVVGPWNRELVEQCMRELDAHARVLAATGPHVGLAIVRESILSPPDAFENLRRATAYSAAHLNCIGNVVVAGPDVEGWQLVRSMYADMYSGRTPYCLADDEASGRAWALALLAQHGF
jgi:hypothetical protein